jgi:hypothetical protein
MVQLLYGGLLGPKVHPDAVRLLVNSEEVVNLSQPLHHGDQVEVFHSDPLDLRSPRSVACPPPEWPSPEPLRVAASVPSISPRLPLDGERARLDRIYRGPPSPVVVKERGTGARARNGRAWRGLEYQLSGQLSDSVSADLDAIFARQDFLSAR